MPVVRKPLSVQVHQRPKVEVGRQDVVGEVTVAVISRLLGDLRRADCTVPDERGHVVQRTRNRGEALQRRPEGALPIDHILAPESVQQVVVLERQLKPLADVLAEPRIHRNRVPAAEHQVHASGRDVLQHRVVLGDLDRIVGRYQRHRRAQDDPVRQRGDMRQQRRRRGREEGRVVVLPDREHVEPDLVRPLRDLARIAVDPLRLARRMSRHRVGRHIADREDSKLHFDRLSLRAQAIADTCARMYSGRAEVSPKAASRWSWVRVHMHTLQSPFPAQRRRGSDGNDRHGARRHRPPGSLAHRNRSFSPREMSSWSSEASPCW